MHSITSTITADGWILPIIHGMAGIAIVQSTRGRIIPRLCRSMASKSTALPSARYLQKGIVTQEAPDAATEETPKNLTEAQREMLHAALRVDQAGEVAANWIYKGQLAVLGRDPKSGPIITVCLTCSPLVGLWI